MTMSRGLEMSAMNTGWVSKTFNFHNLCIYYCLCKPNGVLGSGDGVGFVLFFLESGARQVY